VQVSPASSPSPSLVASTFQIVQAGTLGRVAYSAVLGANSYVWFTSNAHSIFEWSVMGAGSEHPVPAGGADPASVTEGPDGAVWFTAGSAVGRVALNGEAKVFPATDGQPSAGIATGADGALWYTELGRDRIARISTTGKLTEFSLPPAPQEVQCGGWCPEAIVSGPDGALWFTESQLAAGSGIGRITTTGEVTHWRVPNVAPNSIASSPDGSIWFGEDRAAQLGRITSTGDVTELAISGDGYGTRAVAVGQGLVWFSVMPGPIDGSGPGRVGVLLIGSRTPTYYDVPGSAVITQILPLSNGGAMLIDFNGKVFEANPTNY
jgi:virginiamycin B lyase